MKIECSETLDSEFFEATCPLDEVDLARLPREARSTFTLCRRAMCRYTRCLLMVLTRRRILIIDRRLANVAPLPSKLARLREELSRQSVALLCLLMMLLSNLSFS